MPSYPRDLTADGSLRVPADWEDRVFVNISDKRGSLVFDEFMSSMTDAPVEAVIDGNVLHGFALTIGYPNAKAWVEMR